MLIKQTLSFCTTCYKRIPADICVEAGRVVMHKTCSEHGQHSGVVEPDAKFYGQCMAAPTRGIYGGYLMDVTARCNLACKYCYRGQENGPDPTIANLLQEAQVSRYTLPIIVTGGEPTLRGDLPKLIHELCAIFPHQVTMLTNAVKLDEGLLRELVPLLTTADGVLHINVSMHPESKGADVRLLEMVAAMGLRVESALFVVDNFGGIDDAVATTRKYAPAIAATRIKAVSRLWSEQKPEIANKIYTSEMLDHVTDCYDAQPIWWANNKPSFFNVLIDGSHYMLVSWYDATNVDLLDINCPPLYRAKNGVAENLVTAAIVNEGMAQGWLNGKRITTGDM